MASVALTLAQCCAQVADTHPYLAPIVGAGASVAYLDADTQAVVFRGTVNIQGWVHDFDAVDDPVYGLGKVHRGFYDALTPLLPDLLAQPVPKIVAGHSLGAALAILYAGILALRGIAVSIYAFEPPRPVAGDTLAETFARVHAPWLATRNGNDIVTQVPPWFTLPGPLTRIGTAAYPFDNWTDHHIDRVVASVKALPNLHAQALEVLTA